MKLPADAIVDPRKITDYLLRWRPDGDKSQFLAQAGYGQEHADQLMADLRELLTLEAEIIPGFEYGRKYRLRGALRGPNGRILQIASIWVTLETTGETKFVTLYPDQP